MPTMTGNNWAQYLGYRKINGPYVDTVTLYPNNRDVMAEGGISLLSSTKKSFWVDTGISAIVSNGVYESFDPPLPRIRRFNVTQISFTTSVSSHTQAWTRQVINYWE